MALNGISGSVSLRTDPLYSSPFDALIVNSGTGEVTRRNRPGLAGVPENARWVHFPSADNPVPMAYSVAESPATLTHVDIKTGKVLCTSSFGELSPHGDWIVHRFPDGHSVTTQRVPTAPVVASLVKAAAAIFQGNFGRAKTGFVKALTGDYRYDAVSGTPHAPLPHPPAISGYLLNDRLAVPLVLGS